MAKIIPSIRSKNPPWPGNKSLVFLVLAFLLKNEINKSPNCDVSEINNVMKNSKKKLNSTIRSLKTGTNKIENINRCY